ncbi:MAG: hypothetical protein ACJKSS_00980 [Patescibacteria group bacterium UBA2103]
MKISLYLAWWANRNQEREKGAIEYRGTYEELEFLIRCAWISQTLDLMRELKSARIAKFLKDIHPQISKKELRFYKELKVKLDLAELASLEEQGSKKDVNISARTYAPGSPESWQEEDTGYGAKPAVKPYSTDGNLPSDLAPTPAPSATPAPPPVFKPKLVSEQVAVPEVKPEPKPVPKPVQAPMVCRDPKPKDVPWEVRPRTKEALSSALSLLKKSEPGVTDPDTSYALGVIFDVIASGECISETDLAHTARLFLEKGKFGSHVTLKAKALGLA